MSASSSPRKKGHLLRRKSEEPKTSALHVALTSTLSGTARKDTANIVESYKFKANRMGAHALIDHHQTTLEYLSREESQTIENNLTMSLTIMRAIMSHKNSRASSKSIKTTSKTIGINCILNLMKVTFILFRWNTVAASPIGLILIDLLPPTRTTGKLPREIFLVYEWLYWKFIFLRQLYQRRRRDRRLIWIFGVRAVES